MVLVSHRHQFIFIKSKKTAGTSVDGFLERFCLSPEEEKTHQCQHHRESYHSEYGIIGSRMKFPSDIKAHFSAQEIRDLIGEEKWNNYFKFTIVRNPWDKVVSHYYFWKSSKKNRHSPLTFRQFVRRLKRSTDWHLYTLDDHLCCDYHIRYENLKDDLAEVCQKLNLDCDLEQLPTFKGHQRQDKQKHYSEYYDQQTQEYVAQLFSKEIQHFGYQFESR